MSWSWLWEIPDLNILKAVEILNLLFSSLLTCLNSVVDDTDRMMYLLKEI